MCLHTPAYMHMPHTQGQHLPPLGARWRVGFFTLDVIQAKGLGKNEGPSAKATHYCHQYHYYYPIHCWALDLLGMITRPLTSMFSAGSSQGTDPLTGDSQRRVSRESSENRPPRPCTEGQRERQDEGPFARIECQPRRLDDVLTGL